MTTSRFLAAFGLAAALFAGACEKENTPAAPGTGDKPAPAPATGAAPATPATPVTPPAKPVDPAPTPPAAGASIVGTWVVDIDATMPSVEKMISDMAAQAPEKPTAEQMKQMMDAAKAEMAKITFEVKADKTYVAKGAQDEAGTWEGAGDTYTFKSPDGTTATAKVTGNSARVEQMGIVMVLKRK